MKGFKRLDTSQKHVIRLIGRDRDINGWVKLSDQVHMSIIDKMPLELVEYKTITTDTFIRLTPNGEKVLYAMDWLC